MSKRRRGNWKIIEDNPNDGRGPVREVVEETEVSTVSMAIHGRQRPCKLITEKKLGTIVCNAWGFSSSIDTSSLLM